MTNRIAVIAGDGAGPSLPLPPGEPLVAGALDPGGVGVRGSLPPNTAAWVRAPEGATA